MTFSRNKGQPVAVQVAQNVLNTFVKKKLQKCSIFKVVSFFFLRGVIIENNKRVEN